MKNQYRSVWANTSIFVILLFVFAPGLAVGQMQTGIDTLNLVPDPECNWCGEWEFYDFSEGVTFLSDQTDTYDADIRGSSNEGVNFGQEFSEHVRDFGIQLLGTGNADTVTSVPEWTGEAPWVSTSWEATGYQPIETGQLWAVYTAEDHYVVIEIMDLPDGDFGESLVFKYKYQSDGTRFFEATEIGGGGPISGSATSTDGTGFDFSREEVGDNHDAGDYLLDFAFVNNEGVNFGNEGSSSLNDTGRRFILLGEGSLSSVQEVPERVDEAPWVTVSYDFSDGTGGLPISVGELWGVYTREGNYAIMEITELPDGDFGSSFTFDYKYLPDGSRFFDGDGGEPGTPPSAPTLVYPENMASGVSNYPLFIWNSEDAAASYHIQLASDAGFSTIVEESAEVSDTTWFAEALSVNTTYYWRVSAENNNGVSDWSEEWSFTTFSDEFSGGDGSEENPYQIENIVQLQSIQNHLSSHFEIISDIDASSTSMWNEGAGFAPLGEGRTSFTGSLQGKGHVISGLTINRPSENSVGLFSQIAAGAVVRQLGLEDVNIEGQNAIGALAGSNYGFIEEVYSTGFITGQAPSGNRVGGLVGINYGGTMQNSYSYATVSGDEGVGGLIGGAIDSVKLYNSYASNEVTGNSWVYGLVGYMSAMVDIRDSYWNTETSGLSNGYAGDGEGENGLTEAEMKIQDSYENWDFITVWQIDELESFPTLRFTQTEAAEQPEPVELLSVESTNDDNNLRLTWTQSNDEAFLRYRIYMSTDEETFAQVDSTDRDGFSVDSAWTIQELEMLQEYYFKITVVNVYMMESEFSNVMSGVPYPKPSSVENLVATPGDSSVHLSWSPVDTAYFGYYLVSGGEVGQDHVTLDTLWAVHDTSTVIENLTNGTEYLFYISVVNEFGRRGSSSAQVTATPVSGPTVSTENLPDIPETFDMQQNYPNPFNPSTVISFSLPTIADVKIEVFDITGKRVATLVNEQMAAGNHKLNFDAGNLSSGMYIYMMKTNTGEIFTRKMVLIK